MQGTPRLSWAGVAQLQGKHSIPSLSCYFFRSWFLHSTVQYIYAESHECFQHGQQLVHRELRHATVQAVFILPYQHGSERFPKVGFCTAFALPACQSLCANRTKCFQLLRVKRMYQKPPPVIPYKPSSSFHIKEHRGKRFQKIIFCIVLALKAFVQTRQHALGHMQTLTFTRRWPREGWWRGNTAGN